MRKPAGVRPSPPTASSKRKSLLARLEASVSVNGLSHLVLGIYALISASVWWFGAYKEFHYGHGPNGEDVWQRWPIAIARGFGFTLNFNVQLVFLVACRKLLTWLRSTSLSIFIPFDQAMPAFHMALGYTIAGSAVLHAIFHLIAGLTPGGKRIGWASGFGGWTQAAVTGFVLSTILGIMILTSLPAVRRKHFERFYGAHLLGAALFFGVLIFHGMLSGKLYTYKWITAPVVLYVLDRGLRTLQTHSGTVSLVGDDEAAMHMVSPNVARLALPRCFSWAPGQYAELRVPSLSRTQWHPFTIASAPHEESMVFFVKSGGDWTRALCDMVRAADAGRSGEAGAAAPTHLDVQVRGPFGAPAQHTGQYSRVLLVAGGVGVTPFLAVAKDADRLIRANRAADAKAAAAAAAASGTSAASSRRQSTSRRSVGADGRTSVGGSRRGSVDGAAPGGALEGVTVHDVGRSFAYEGDAVGAAALTEVLSEAADGGRAAAPATSGSMTRSSGLSGDLESDPEAASSSEDEWAVDDEGPDGEATAAAPDGDAAIFEESAYGAFASRHASLAHFLRSVTVSYAAMWVLLARIGLLALAATVHHVSMGASPGLTPYDARGLIIADLVLSALFAAPVVGSVLLEAAAAASALSLATAADDVALTVVSVVGVVLPALALAGVASDTSTPVGYLYALVLLPATVGAFGWRHTHLLASTLLVAPTRERDVSRLRAVDFLWTAPTVADDGWVVGEVASIGDTVRLHRFGTRETAPPLPPPVEDEASTPGSSANWEGVDAASAASPAASGDIEAGVAPAGTTAKALTAAVPARPSLDDRRGSMDSVTSAGGRLSLNYGRPSWEGVLSTLVAHSRSGSVVGIFVCGPVAMTDAVRDAAKSAMRASREAGRRGGRARVGHAPGGKGRAGDYGRNVRLTVRAENF